MKSNINRFFFKSFLIAEILSAHYLAQVSEFKLMIILNLKSSHVFKNEDRISFINLNLFSSEIAEEDVSSINFIILNAEVLMLMLMM